MQSSNLCKYVLSAFLLPVLFASSSHAQVYRWVDANGQTHYSERKADVGSAKAEEVKIPPPPERPQTSTPSTDYTEYLRAPGTSAPPRQTSTGKTYKPPLDRTTQSLSDGKDHGTDESRCALARDILSGAVRHGKGKPTDKYDREVAQNDVKAFCHSR